jgi:hypothetical protein
MLGAATHCIIQIRQRLIEGLLVARLRQASDLARRGPNQTNIHKPTGPLDIVGPAQRWRQQPGKRQQNAGQQYYDQSRSTETSLACGDRRKRLGRRKHVDWFGCGSVVH